MRLKTVRDVQNLKIRVVKGTNSHWPSAGIPAESLRGSRTAVFSASMLEDYARMAAMDPDNTERTAVTGSTVACVIPNRVSWYFDLRGPSIHVNTACSSALSAVDMACKSLQAGDASCVSVVSPEFDFVQYKLNHSLLQRPLSQGRTCFSTLAYFRSCRAAAFCLRMAYAIVSTTAPTGTPGARASYL
jgi:hypothetical protein